MSQKTNPSSLRISSKYKNFSSCWYSDYFYHEMISYDLQIRSYIEAVLDQSLHSQAFIRIQNDYKRCFISLFFLDARGIRHSREKALRLPLLSLQNLSQQTFKLGPSTPWRESASKNTLSTNVITTSAAAKSFSLPQFAPKTQKDKFEISPLKETKTLLSIKSSFQGLYNGFFEINPQCSLYSQVNKCNEKGNQKTNNIFTETKATNFHSRLENSIHLLNCGFPVPLSRPLVSSNKFAFGNHTGIFGANARKSIASIHPIRVIQDIQNAEFLAREIVYLLQKRAAFREIQSHILRQVVKSDMIKGIRISCSGRVGGRSKKAQKAKTQSVQWGESGLHVFSSKLDFASKSASTLFGKVGIKVWLCFK